MALHVFLLKYSEQVYYFNSLKKDELHEWNILSKPEQCAAPNLEKSGRSKMKTELIINQKAGARIP